MMLRVENTDGSQQFRMAYSRNGVRFTVNTDRLLFTLPDDPGGFEPSSCDSRMTAFGDRFYITFAARGERGVRIALAKTADFKTFESIGFISQPGIDSGVLFPERIGGRYARLEHPCAAHTHDSGGDLWISFSPDLIHWGDARLLAQGRAERLDGHLLGAGPAPIRTSEGWLVLYHGESEYRNGSVRRCGVMLLDLEQPWNVLARSRGYVLGPQEPYERVGDHPNAVCVTGAVVEEDATVRLYYAGAETVVCLAHSSISELIRSAYHE